MVEKSGSPGCFARTTRSCVVYTGPAFPFTVNVGVGVPAGHGG